MKRNHHAGQKRLALIVSCVAILAFVLAACGSSGGAGPTPTPTPTSSQGYGTAHGCPSDAVVTPEPPAVNVTVTLSDANRTLTAHVGDVIEIHLPFGLRWTGPAISRGGLQLQTPAGYASPSKGMCIWRLHALLVESDNPQELTAFLQPYMDLMDVDVHAVYALDYDALIEELRQVIRSR